MIALGKYIIIQSNDGSYDVSWKDGNDRKSISINIESIIDNQVNLYNRNIIEFIRFYNEVSKNYTIQEALIAYNQEMGTLLRIQDIKI